VLTYGALALITMLAGTGAPAVNLALPVPGAETVGIMPCNDGHFIEVKFFDPNPDDPKAGVYEFWVEGHRVGAVDISVPAIFVDATRERLTKDQAEKKYPSPCNFPSGPGA
jgi:hypothetical protein